MGYVLNQVVILDMRLEQFILVMVRREFGNMNVGNYLEGFYFDSCEMIIVQSRRVEMEESVQNKRDLRGNSILFRDGLEWRDERIQDDFKVLFGWIDRWV